MLSLAQPQHRRHLVSRPTTAAGVAMLNLAQPQLLAPQLLLCSDLQLLLRQLKMMMMMMTEWMTQLWPRLFCLRRLLALRVPTSCVFSDQARPHLPSYSQRSSLMSILMQADASQTTAPLQEAASMSGAALLQAAALASEAAFRAVDVLTAASACSVARGLKSQRSAMKLHCLRTEHPHPLELLVAHRRRLRSFQLFCPVYIMRLFSTLDNVTTCPCA